MHNFFDLRRQDEYPDDVNQHIIGLARGFDPDRQLENQMLYMQNNKLYGDIRRYWYINGVPMVVFSAKCQRGIFCVATATHVDDLKQFFRAGEHGPVIRDITARSRNVSFGKQKHTPEKGKNDGRSNRRRIFTRFLFRR